MSSFFVKGRTVLSFSCKGGGPVGKRRRFVCVSGDSPSRDTEQSQGQSTRANPLKICVYLCVCGGGATTEPITGAVTVVRFGSHSLKHKGEAGEITTVTRKEKKSH